MRSVAVLALSCFTVLNAAAPPKPLSIQNAALSQYEDGPGVPASSFFVAGETVWVSFQVSGYRSTAEDEPAIKLSWRIEAADAAGVPVVEPLAGNIAAVLAREDKNWMPKARGTILIPPFAGSGKYHLKLYVKDEIANAEVHRDVEFAVHGREVLPAASLVLRDIGFYRGEEDKAALNPASYRPGDTVWIRFEIDGFKLGEQNRLEVGYGVTVARPNGDVLFQQPEAAVERDQTFYPRRYLPAGLRLDLTRDLLPGQYTVTIKADDKVGAQSTESAQTFTVER